MHNGLSEFALDKRVSHVQQLDLEMRGIMVEKALPPRLSTSKVN